ncbi:hypothetical protein [uncultured Tateyamaria sp.]|uniref:hypothetical protein n=1 Tax=uncultured Tateyamaria sp. TaxID=455651 RepID=UPI0026301B82|nr:hypothetical protein [uncultured Tateyamaria sp.]
MAYSIGLLVLSCINFIPQMLGSDEAPMVFPLVIIGTAIMVAIWSAIPVFGIFLPLVWGLRSLGVPTRLSAVLAAGTASGFGAVLSARFYGEVFGTIGGEGSLARTEIIAIILIAMAAAFLVWTVSPAMAENA